MTEDPRQRVLLVGRVPVSGATTLGDWQLARALTECGVRVTYVDPPRFVHHVVDPRRPGPGPMTADLDGIDVVRPIAGPGANTSRGAGLADRVLAWQVRRAVAGHDDHLVATVIADPRRAGMVDHLPRPAVFWRRDRFQAGEGRHAAGAERERRALSRFDAVSSVSPALSADVAGAARRRVVIRNGCAAHHFARTPEPPTGDPTTIALVGGVGWRVDLDLLAHVATARPEWHVDVFGPVVRDDLPRLPNVTFHGAVPFATLPEHLAGSRVGLIPYVDDPFNRASFPLKAFEYLAAGRPVVSTPIDALAEYAPHVRIAHDAPGFVAAVEAALAEGPDPASCRAVAAANSWKARARELMGLLAELGPIDLTGIR